MKTISTHIYNEIYRRIKIYIELPGVSSKVPAVLSLQGTNFATAQKSPFWGHFPPSPRKAHFWPFWHFGHFGEFPEFQNSWNSQNSPFLGFWGKVGFLGFWVFWGKVDFGDFRRRGEKGENWVFW